MIFIQMECFKKVKLKCRSTFRDSFNSVKDKDVVHLLIYILDLNLKHSTSIKSSFS